MPLSSELVKLERDSVAKLKPQILNKEINEVHKEGLRVTCIPCSLYRCKAHVHVRLR